MVGRIEADIDQVGAGHRLQVVAVKSGAQPQTNQESHVAFAAQAGLVPGQGHEPGALRRAVRG
jgi:hypothetical protein